MWGGSTSGSAASPAEVGCVSHPDGAPLARSPVIGDTLYAAGPGANRLPDFSAIGFTLFG